MAQPRANFVLLERGSGPRVEISCQVSSGSPPITYSLVRKDGHVHRQQTPTYGQPANFSFPLTRTSNWLRCQAENDISVQSSPFRLVPPGERAPWFPDGHLALLGRSVEEAPSLLPRAGKGFGKLPCLLWPHLRELSSSTPLPHRTPAPGTCLGAGWQPHLHCSCHLLGAGPGLVDQVGTGCGMWRPLCVDHQEPGWRQRAGL